MSKNPVLYKTLVVGVIVLFIGASITSLAGSLSIQKSLAFGNEGNSGISLITIKVDGETVNDWYVSDVGFNFTYQSEDIAEIKYMIDGGQYHNYTEPFYLSDDGKDILLEWCAVNHEGDYSDVDGPFICSIDQTEPEIDLTYEVLGWTPMEGWEFQFTATATDAMSGMERVDFYVISSITGKVLETVYGSGPEYVWTCFYFPNPGYVCFGARAFDKAGNSECDEIISSPNDVVLESSMSQIDINDNRMVNSCSEDVKVSEAVECKSLSVEEKFPLGHDGGEVFDPSYVIVVFNRKPGNNGWIISNVTIPIFYDSNSIDEVYYQINDGDWIEYAAPKIVSDDGLYTFSWYALDYNGYTSTTESVYMKIDRTKPDINLIRRRLGVNSIKYIAEVDDETSGIDRVKFCEYAHGPTYFVDHDYPFEWIHEGFIPKSVVTAVAFDEAGNRAFDENHFGPSLQKISQNPWDSLFFRLFDCFPMLERVLSLL